MKFETLMSGGLDYLPCRYGRSKLMFRGPKKGLAEPYVAIIGGNETYGKFIETPLSELLERNIGTTTVNLGHANAGVDAFWHDAAVLEICQRADLTVVQVLGAQNMSNRLYTVHPRRNDRFVKASNFLQTLYRNVDFTQFHYTRHLLTALHEESPDRFALVREELQTAWMSRMESLLHRIGGDICLMWLSDRPVPAQGDDDPLGQDPLFVNRSMLDALSGRVLDTIEVVATREEIAAGRERMVYSPLEEPVAHEMLGPVVHEAAARALQNVAEDVL